MIDAGPANPCAGLPEGWWDCSFTERVRVVPYNGTTGTVTQYPFLIDLDGQIDFSAARPSGADLRVLTDDLEARPFERAIFDRDQDRLVLWTSIETLRPDQQEDGVWLYWGNPDAADAADAEGLWALADYVFVAHLEGGSLFDSASAANVIVSGTPGSGAGLLGGGLELDATDSFTSPFAQTVLDPVDGTVELWAAPTSADGNGTLFGDPGADGNRATVTYETLGEPSFTLETILDVGGGTGFGSVSQAFPPDIWRYLALRWSDLGAGDRNLELLVNGESLQPQLEGGFASWTLSGQPFVVGGGFVGRIDEVRLRLQAVSDEWIAMRRAESVTGSPVTVDPPPLFAEGPHDDNTVHQSADLIYSFDEGAGTVIANNGTLTGYDITIADPTRVRWVDGGLEILQAQPLLATAGAESLKNRCDDDGLTIEAWIQPANQQQVGPARIVGYSENQSRRAFSLMAGFGATAQPTAYSMRLHTSETTTNGAQNDGSHPVTPEGAVKLERQHVVMRWGPGSPLDIFVDDMAAPAVSESWGGTLSDTWTGNDVLVLGDETVGRRGWLGAYYHVATWCRRLSNAELMTIEDAGPR